jgi:steroid delta-isomerase-like uncharacterized protein
MSEPDGVGRMRSRREAIVREHMDAENRLDFDATIQTFDHPRYELVATGQVFDGEAEVMGYYRASRTAFPDQRNEIHSIRATDDAVVAEFDLLGTNTGEFYGLEPTGREFRVRMIAVFEFGPGDDARIVCERVYFDSASLLRQIGRSELVG